MSDVKAIDPTFTLTPDGWSISGLTDGTWRILDEYIPMVMKMSHDGEFYPYQIVACCIDVGKEPKQWLCAVRETY